MTEARAGIVHSVLAATVEQAEADLARAPERIAYVEIRADRLRAAEAAGLVRAARHPAIVTVREPRDGGAFTGSAEEKRAILEATLAAGAAFVDVEMDGPAAGLAEGRHAGRTILSHHGGACAPGALSERLARMERSRAARLKLVPVASRAAEIGAVREALSRAGGRLAAFASGREGLASRVLALSWGSWGTYGAPARGRESAPGQPTTRDLKDVYRADRISPATALHALCGRPVLESPSPVIHAAGYRAAGIDAVYIPVECGDLSDLDPLPLAGLAVTTPLKGAAARRCDTLDPSARAGAVNTVEIGPAGWTGHNTDVLAAEALLGPLLPGRGSRAAIVGAGDSARAIGGLLAGRGLEVTFFTRTPRDGALPLDRLPGALWEVLVQATPLGSRGERVPVPEALPGRAVLDLAYGPEITPLVREARAQGLVAIDGQTFLLEQALLQFALMTGRQAPRAEMAAALDAFWGAA